DEIDPAAVWRPGREMVVDSRPVPRYPARIGARAVRHEDGVSIAERVVDDKRAVRRPGHGRRLLAEKIPWRTSCQRDQPHPQTDITPTQHDLRAIARKTCASQGSRQLSHLPLGKINLPPGAQLSQPNIERAVVIGNKGCKPAVRRDRGFGALEV